MGRAGMTTVPIPCKDRQVGLQGRNLVPGVAQWLDPSPNSQPCAGQGGVGGTREGRPG